MIWVGRDWFYINYFYFVYNVCSTLKCPTEAFVFTSEKILFKTLNVSKKVYFKDLSWKDYKEKQKHLVRKIQKNKYSGKKVYENCTFMKDTTCEVVYLKLQIMQLFWELSPSQVLLKKSDQFRLATFLNILTYFSLPCFFWWKRF